MSGTHTGCSNSGTIKVKGMTGDGKYPMYAAGVSAQPDKISRCSNSGKVAVENLTNNDVYVGGVAAYYGVKVGYVCTRCFNTGTISTNAKGKVGGVAGLSNSTDKWTVIHCYNTGKVSGKKGSIFVGGLLGSYDNALALEYGSYFIRDNYSTTSPLYGRSQISWEPFWARGTKVSSITSKSCTKFSRKYWTYSSKHKRLILKNNKEK